MASSGDYYTVKLLENEVSGEILSHSNVSQNSVISLKRWIECRGFPSKGNKTECVKRFVLSLVACASIYLSSSTGVKLASGVKLAN